MKTRNLMLFAGLMLLLGLSEARSADNETLCASWSLHQAKLQQLRTRFRSWMAQPGDRSAMQPAAESITKIQEQTRAVLEENARWQNSTGDMGIQLMPVAKAEYRSKAEKIIATIESAAGQTMDSDLRQELLFNPLSLTRIIPGPSIQVANCGDTYLIYQPNPSQISGSAPADNVTLGNLSQMLQK